MFYKMFLKNLLMKNWFCSSFKHKIIYFIHLSYEREDASFHLRRISLLDNSVVKAPTPCVVEGKFGLKEIPNSCERVWSGWYGKGFFKSNKYLNQNSVSLGQDQNMWVWFTGDCQHLLQVLLLSGYILANLA